MAYGFIAVWLLSITREITNTLLATIEHLSELYSIFKQSLVRQAVWREKFRSCNCAFVREMFGVVREIFRLVREKKTGRLQLACNIMAVHEQDQTFREQMKIIPAPLHFPRP